MELTPIRVLSIGKSAYNEEQVSSQLGNLGHVARFHSVIDLAEALLVFDWGIFDVVTLFVDSDTPGVSSLLEEASKKFLQVPVVLITPIKRVQLNRLAKRLGVHKVLVQSSLSPSKIATNLITTREQFQAGLVSSADFVSFQEAVDQHYEAVCRCLADTTITFINRPCALQLGVPMNQLLGAKLSDVLDVDSMTELRVHLDALNPSSPTNTFERRINQRQHSRWISWCLRGIFDERGRLLEVQATGVDVTDLIRNQKSLAKRAHCQAAISRLGQRALAAKTLSEIHNEVVVVVSETLALERSSVLIRNRTGRFVTCAATGISFARIGKEIDDSSNDSIGKLVAMGSRSFVVPDWSEEQRIENSYVVGRGIQSSIICPVVNGENQAIGIVCAHSRQLARFTADDVEFLETVATILSDAIQQDVAQHCLAEEKERLRITLNSIGDGVISTDPLGRIQYLNPVAEQLTGWSLEDAVGLRIHEVFCIIDEHSRQEVESPVAKCLRENKASDSRRNSLLLSRNGSEYTVQDSVAPITEEEDQVVGVVLVFRNVSETQMLSRRITHQASHDSLTGLINRGAFEKRLRETLRDSKNNERAHSLCFLNLDQFKIVNEACGHAAGDTVLRQISHLFKEKIRKTDTLSRLGGDEFAILMEDCSVVSAQRVARQLCAAVESYRYQYGSKSFTFSVSVGVITLGGSLNSVSTVLQAAEKACTVAKESGRNRVHVLSSSGEDLERWYGEIEWVARIQDALDRDRFCIYAQVISPTNATDKTETPLHIELLIRLQADDGSIICPGAFLPAVERYHLAPRLDRWMIQHAFNWLVEHFDELDDLAMCSINLSGQTICDEDFERYLVELFELTGVPENKICFEISETAAMTNLNEATNFINTLQKRGVRFALDDFGSGLSSFGYLKALPVDYLKIDGLFVKDIEDNPIDLAMVRSINDIGQLMGKITIAEHVENGKILNQLRTLGVDMVQGYEIGKPKPLDEIWGAKTMVAEEEPIATESIDHESDTMKLSNIVFLS